MHKRKKGGPAGPSHFLFLFSLFKPQDQRYGHNDAYQRQPAP